MKKNLFKRLAVLCGALLMSLAMVATPIVTTHVEAKAPDTAEIQKEAVGWIYAEAGGAMWKRLFNYSTGQWESEWIFVRWL